MPLEIEVLHKRVLIGNLEEKKRNIKTQHRFD